MEKKNLTPQEQADHAYQRAKQAVEAHANAAYIKHLKAVNDAYLHQSGVQNSGYVVSKAAISNNHIHFNTHRACQSEL